MRRARRRDRAASLPPPASAFSTRTSNGERITRRLNSASMTRFAPPEPVRRSSLQRCALMRHPASPAASLTTGVALSVEGGVGLLAGLRTFLVPVVVVRPHAAPRALRARPSPLASGAFAVRLESVPDFAAAGRARPHILARRAPLARRAADAGEVLVDVVFENARNEAVLFPTPSLPRTKPMMSGSDER